MARAVVRQLVGADVLNADAPPPRLGAPRGPRVGWRVARGPSGSGLIGPGSGLRTRAALCTASLTSPPRFLGTHCLLFPVILSARGRGSRLTAHLPAPAACSCFALGDPLPVSLSQASQGRLGQRGRTGCGVRVILPLGTACVCHPTSAPRGACLPCRHQLPTSLGLQSWRSG